MLVGRSAEQRQLDLLLRRARAGISGVLVLRGDPGIGKTALVDYAASCAGPMRILRTTGIEAETGLAFAGLYSLLNPLADYLTALPERQAAALRTALGLAQEEIAPGRLAVAAGTHALLTAAAEDRGLLVLADDVHWLDPASLEALLFALRRLDRDAIACVMTLRADIPALAGLPRRDLAGLRREAAAQLAEAVSGTKPAPAVARRLHAETGGNPLALVELSAALTADQLGGAGFPELPLQPGAAIQQRFAVRLDQLSPQGRIALLVAAAAGRCPAAEVSAAAARLGADGSDALGEAEAAGLVRLASGGVEFSHPLMRSVAYHIAVPSQRRAAHRALADVQAGRDAERTAWHLAAAATGPDRADVCRLAGNAAFRLRKWNDALGWYLQLSDVESSNPVVLYNCAVAYYNMGKYDDAFDYYSRARDRDPVIRNVDIERRHAGDTASGAPRVSLIDSLYNAGVALQNAGGDTDAEMLYDSVLARDSLYSMAWNNLGVIYGRRGEINLAEKAYLKAVERRHDIPETYANLVNLYIQLEQYKKARQWLSKGEGYNPASDLWKDLKQRISEAENEAKSGTDRGDSAQ